VQTPSHLKINPYFWRLCSTSSGSWLYCGLKLWGRLAQRLEHSVYTRKVVRSNRTLPTIRENHFSGDVVQLVRTRRWLESYTVTAEPQSQLPFIDFR
jgi:hypothetical protein